jgi:TRAP-type C4-dicarboxylate transport system permease small subunit
VTTREALPEPAADRIPGALRPLHALSVLANRGLAVAAGIALAAMTLFTVLDVVLRGLGRPVAGSFEVIGWLSAVAVSLALGYTQAHRGHVAMTLLTDALRGRGAALLDALNAIAALVLYVIVAWVVIGYGQTLQESGSLSETLKALVYPWVYVVAIGFMALALTLLVDALLALVRLFRPTDRARA